MSQEGKKKRGTAGAENAKWVPYRYIGGSHEHPFLTDPRAREAVRSGASPFRNFAPYAQGMLGGVLAAMLGYERGFESWRQMAQEAQKAAE